jgi:hypothetical protein
MSAGWQLFALALRGDRIIPEILQQFTRSPLTRFGILALSLIPHAGMHGQIGISLKLFLE